MKRYLHILLLTLFAVCGLSVSPVLAQEQGEENRSKGLTVSGIVVDDKGEPLPGVSVVVKNQPGRGATTNLDGKFSIKVNRNDVLVFRFIGMKTVERAVTKSITGLRIALKEDTSALEEVVVTGLTSQKKVSVVGAISTISPEELKTPGASLVQSLVGRIPGVMTFQASGEPGQDDPSFWVRGISTFGAGEAALVLIDGIEGRLSDIDVDDIESFSVLKDASATAVYGVRGAGGVVIVTTKRGAKDKLSISGRASMTVKQIPHFREYLGAYDYAVLANEARAVSGLSDLYTPLQLDLIKYGLDQDIYPTGVDWTKEIMNKYSTQQEYYVSARGGGDIARYFVSLRYRTEGAAYNQKDNIFDKPFSVQKMSYRVNVDMNLTKLTTLYLGVDGHLDSKTQPGGIGTNAIWGALQRLNPLMFPVEFSDGTLPTYGGGANLISPYAALNYYGYRDSDDTNNIATVKLTQKFSGFLEGLTVSSQAVVNQKTFFSESRNIAPNLYRVAPSRDPQGKLVKTLHSRQRDLSYSSNDHSWRKYYFEAKANYNRSFGSHNVGALLFYYMEDEKASNQGFGDNLGIRAIAHRRQNLSARLHYGFKNTYFFDANFGYTGSAQFKKGERFGLFPSIAAGWVPSNYDVFKKAMPWFSFLKIRASYGLAGNDKLRGATRFPYLTLINHHAPTTWGYEGQGIREYQIGADNLRWEVAKKANLGIEAKFFDNRLSFTIDIFNDVRDGIYRQRQTIPSYAGLVTQPYSNTGKMHSYGSDGSFSYRHSFNKHTQLTFRGNYTFSQNIVDHYEEPLYPYAYQAQSGKPYNILRGYIAEGLFKSREEIETSPRQTFGAVRPGDIKYRDVNGDGVVNNQDQVPLSYANQLPRMSYGFGFDFQYKSFNLGALFSGAIGKEYYRSGFGNGAGWIPFWGGAEGNVIKIANNPKNRWTPAWYSGTTATENPNAEFPRLSYGGNLNNTQPSTFWKRDGSFLRFQQLTLRYKLNHKKWLDFVGLRSIDFELSANNLLTIDAVKFFDPENAQNNGASYPRTRNYTLQLYLNF